MNNRLEEYRKLIQTATKDLAWIGTEISPCSLFINIKVVIGNQKRTISIPISDIEANMHSGKGFIDLIAKPLEDLLTPR